MDIHSIKKYYAEVDKIIHFGGSRKETSIRNAFYVLLNEYAKQKDLVLVAEVTVKTKEGKNVMPDGTLKDMLRQDWGYWESKDESDVLDDEIEKKFNKGYPKDNILFEDSQTAVLIQDGAEVMRVSMRDMKALDRILKAFVNFERPEVKNFRTAIEMFKDDIPEVTERIRNVIIEQGKTNTTFIEARDKFLEFCRESINPDIVIEDIREMMIQHILTEDIFNTVFDESHFHQENNVARELEKIIHTFFTGNIRRSVLSNIQHYFQAINAAAAGIPDHHEKQKFLKVVYETFYKSYNPKAADRLGVVYTPNEIVKFMIESTDYLLYHHFGKFLDDKNVEILDPATGTGTFICDIIDHIEDRQKLKYKYENELHANEVAILPYYIANLNIEFTYKQKTGEYREFKNLCFVDTLDNMGFSYVGKQFDMWGVSAENLERIKKQNERKISVIIGNPPYNANQKNENENNKNREYKEIDDRIKKSFVKESTAQKTKVYDMYARFYRWAFDRLNDNGVIAFITNRSFIDSRTFDGFRKNVQDDFDCAYIIDTKSDVRANPKIAGTTHNVFGIQTGVAIMLLIKKTPKQNQKCKIFYISMDDFWRKEEKLQWFATHQLQNINFKHIEPDKKNNWINLVDNDYFSLFPIVDKHFEKQKLFDFFTIGVSTNRDEWVFDLNKDTLKSKVLYFIKSYNKKIKLGNIDFDDDEAKDIKWSDSLKNKYKNKIRLNFKEELFIKFLYRPYYRVNYYYNKNLSDRLTNNHFKIYGKELNNENIAICFSGIGFSKSFTALATNELCGVDFIEKTQCIPLYTYNDANGRLTNITDYGLEKFHVYYQNKKIKKLGIFHYVYGVLHNPAYRKKYELNLKREFPRIPFYEDFYQWAEWGKLLMELHINYETVEPYDLKRIDLKEVKKPKAKLKADKQSGSIILDDMTTLTGVPEIAWDYKLGNRSALEWVLDQYKEKKPRDKTIAEKFNTYKFADYKEHVIDLLKRVCTVSVKTMGVVGEMEGIEINRCKSKT